MEAWLQSAIASRYVKPVGDSQEHQGVYCVAAANPWYDDGVSFDWTELHRRIKCNTDAAAGVVVPVEEVREYGAAQLTRYGEASCLATVVEVRAPWELQPLDPQAQQWSVFSVADSSKEKKKMPGEGKTEERGKERLYMFTRGPPGQRSAREDIHRVLRSVQDQLRANGQNVYQFLSSFIIFSNDFTSLLHLTAAVHKALKQAGFTLDGAGSCMVPRRVLLRTRDSVWATLPLEAVTEMEDVCNLCCDLFFQWLQDSYVWRSLPPVRVFPSLSLKPAQDGTPAATLETQEAAEVETKRVKLFEKFISGQLLSKAKTIGLTTLQEIFEKDHDDWTAIITPRIIQKRPLQGPQKWCTLELRLLLCQLGLYHVDPVAVFSSMSSSA